MAGKQPLDPRQFGQYVTTRARIKGYDLDTADGRSRLAKDTGLPANDITAIAAGKLASSNPAAPGPEGRASRRPLPTWA